MSFPFPGNLGCADLIGIDKAGNMHILVEQVKNEIPLQLIRTVMGISPSGNKLRSFEVPLMKYLSIIKEFEVDAMGNVYQLISDENKVRIIKWLYINADKNNDVASGRIQRGNTR